MGNNSLVERLKFWRAERPDEWTMDEFIWDAKKLEQERNELVAQVERLRGSGGEVEPVGYLHKIPNRIPVFFEIKEDATIQGCDVFPVYTIPTALKAQWQAEAIEQSVKLCRRKVFDGPDLYSDAVLHYASELRQRALESGNE